MVCRIRRGSKGTSMVRRRGTAPGMLPGILTEYVRPPESLKLGYRGARPGGGARGRLRRPRAAGDKKGPAVTTGPKRGTQGSPTSWQSDAVTSGSGPAKSRARRHSYKVYVDCPASEQQVRSVTRRLQPYLLLLLRTRRVSLDRAVSVLSARLYRYRAFGVIYCPRRAVAPRCP